MPKGGHLHSSPPFSTWQKPKTKTGQEKPIGFLPRWVV